MADIPFYTIDAFTKTPFKGNQAAVCILHPNKEPSKDKKQLLAAEFHLSETAFPSPLNETGEDAFEKEKEFKLEWYTPTNEIELCGHATLATAHVIFNELSNKNKEIHFDSLSGRLSVQKSNDGRLQMNFPQYDIRRIDSSFGEFQQFEKLDDGRDTSVAEKLAKAQVGNNAKIIGLAYALKARKLIVVLDSKTKRDDFMKIKVDSSTLMNLEPNGDLVRGIIVTLAPEKSCGFDSNVDYVLRYFAPWHGLSEDPATGSAQSAVGPFWSKLLGKTNLKANQCFPGRGADFEVELDNSIGRINIYGHAITMFRGNFSPEILK